MGTTLFVMGPLALSCGPLALSWRPLLLCHGSHFFVTGPLALSWGSLVIFVFASCWKSEKATLIIQMNYNFQCLLIRPSTCCYSFDLMLFRICNMFVVFSCDSAVRLSIDHCHRENCFYMHLHITNTHYIWFKLFYFSINKLNLS